MYKLKCEELSKSNVEKSKELFKYELNYKLQKSESKNEVSKLKYVGESPALRSADSSVDVKSSENVVEKSSEESKIVCLCGRSVTNFGQYRGYPSVELLVALAEHVNTSGVPNFKGCRIPVVNSSLNMAAWYERLHDYEDNIVCQLLEFGFPLDFNKNQKLNPDVGRNHKGAREYAAFINNYLKKESDAYRLVGPFKANPFSVPLVTSPMNTVPKASEDERRVIVDLSWPSGSSVNDGISKEKYLDEVIKLRYASVEEVCEMVRNVGVGAVIYKRDLKQAYRQIPVDPADYCYLGYHWEGDWYFDTVLAMGQRNAAMACSRVTKAVMYIHGLDGYGGTSYLDDLIGVESPDVGMDAYLNLGTVLYDVGLCENEEKACPPSTTQVVLGVLLNTTEMTISVTEERLKEIKVLLEKWRGMSSASKNELQSLIGKLCFITKCVRQSRVFLNRLLDTLRCTKDRGRVVLSVSFKKDIAWWIEFMCQFNGVSFIPSAVWMEPDFAFSTDSYMKGCGGICMDEYFHAPFPEAAIEDLKIHHLELLTVLIAVRIWGHRCEGAKIQIYCDNDAAVQVINSSKTKDPFMASCIRELWLEVSIYKFELRAIHLPGVENRLADWLSRWDIHPKYPQMFNEFITNEPHTYNEVPISPTQFKFSRDL